MAKAGNIQIEHALSKDLFALPRQYVDDVDSVLISHGLIIDRIQRLARDIVRDSHGPIVALCVLKGGHTFFSDLLKEISTLNIDREVPVPVRCEFIRMKSYSNDRSTGQVTITGADLDQLKDQDVLIVEDIVDTGHSAVTLVSKLKEAQPKRIRFASLLVKNTPLSNGFQPDYTGFRIPNAFVVGYCLDYNEHFRDLHHICVINDHGKQKYAE